MKFIYNKLLSIKTIVGSVIILVLAFVVYQIQYTNQIVSTIITEFYGKSLDFSARTLIWKRAIELIKDHLWLGYGYLDSYQNAQLFGFEWPVAHPHNYYLYLLLTGGILLLLLFLLIIADYAKKVKQHGYSKITVCTTAYIAAILVMGITESMTEFAMFYGALYLAIKCIEISGLETAHLEP